MVRPSITYVLLIHYARGLLRSGVVVWVQPPSENVQTMELVEHIELDEVSAGVVR